MTLRRCATAVTAWLWVACTAGQLVLAAQPLETDQIQLDALQCWRDIGSHSVTVGEPFTMMVTCAVIETDAATTVPDEVILAPETIDLSPFDVIEGQRFTDVHDGPWRYFQYHYTLRVIDEDLFGEDVEIPALELPYHIERTLEGGSSLPGRELRYVLPPHPIRVVSLVPENAEDIREVAGEAFGAAEARLFRANLASVVATGIGVLAVGFLFAALVSIRRERRSDAPRREKLVPDVVIVGRALTELTALQNTAQEQGWNPTLVSRALTALRLAGAAALSAPVAQERVQLNRTDREGQLSVSRGLWRRQTTALSATVTPSAVVREIEHRRRLRPDDSSLDLLMDLNEALQTFSVARYTPNGSIPTDQLTSDLDRGVGVVRKLRFRAMAPIRHTDRLIESARGWWSERWAR